MQTNSHKLLNSCKIMKYLAINFGWQYHLRSCFGWVAEVEMLHKKGEIPNVAKPIAQLKRKDINFLQMELGHASKEIT